jgi:hypothetical protein
MSKVTNKDWTSGKALLWVESGKWKGAAPATANEMLNTLAAELGGERGLKVWAEDHHPRVVDAELLERELRRNVWDALIWELLERPLCAATGRKEVPPGGWSPELCVEVLGGWSKSLGFGEDDKAYIVEYLGKEPTEAEWETLLERVEWAIISICGL